jgi:hypothetical protein
MTKRKRELRTRLSEKDLKARGEFQGRDEGLATQITILEQQMSELRRAQAVLEGEWTFWREKVINPRYNLTMEDFIDDEGVFHRTKESSPANGDLPKKDKEAVASRVKENQ